MKNGKNAETKINNAHNVIDITRTANCTKYLAYTQPQYNEIYYNKKSCELKKFNIVISIHY